MILSGATCSGKTTFLNRLLNEKRGLYGGDDWTVLYCYGVHQIKYEEMQAEMTDITFKQGLPSNADIDLLTSRSGRKILVLDDLAEACVNDPDISKLFTQGMHHRGLSIILVLQNMYQSGKCSRTIALNAFYCVFFENNADRQQIATKARQMYPGNSKKMVDAYEAFTEERYGYMFVDASPGSNPAYRLRTHVFPDEYPIVWTA